MSQSLVERYDDRIAGVLSCYDRVVITGTILVICYAEGMPRFLYAKGIRIFDYPQFAQTLRDRVRDGAASIAASAGVSIEHIAKSHIRKEEVVTRVLEQRGDHPGLVHILSAMEACDSYRPWHDKASGKTFVRPDSGKCLHYYFYFMDAALGLDALNCQREIAQKIIDKGGDYALALKANQVKLHNDVIKYFDNPTAKITATKPVVYANHGRKETRTATVSTEIAKLQKDHD